MRILGLLIEMGHEEEDEDRCCRRSRKSWMRFEGEFESLRIQTLLIGRV